MPSTFEVLNVEKVVTEAASDRLAIVFSERRSDAKYGRDEAAGDLRIGPSPPSQGRVIRPRTAATGRSAAPDPFVSRAEMSVSIELLDHMVSGK